MKAEEVLSMAMNLYDTYLRWCNMHHRKTAVSPMRFYLNLEEKMK